jgi:GTP cyclohydrolase I
MEKIFLNHGNVRLRAMGIAKNLSEGTRVYGVPRGGIPVAYLVAGLCQGSVVDSPDFAHVIVDDIIDTGATRERYACSKKPFYALVDKTEEEEGWFVFPWEVGERDTSADDIVIRMMQYIGEDPTRDGLLDTPKRVLKAWDALYQGYKENPKEILGRTFQNEEHYDEMVILRNIEFYSMCEHHMLPFFGQAHIAYIPNPEGRVVGISKLARLVDCFARRLQIQERLTRQIVDAIEENLQPLGAACFIEAQHLCMKARGVEKQNSVMVTSALTGVFKQKDASRLEFLLLKK